MFNLQNFDFLLHNMFFFTTINFIDLKIVPIWITKWLLFWPPLGPPHLIVFQFFLPVINPFPPIFFQQIRGLTLDSFRTMYSTKSPWPIPRKRPKTPVRTRLVSVKCPRPWPVASTATKISAIKMGTNAVSLGFNFNVPLLARLKSNRYFFERNKIHF